MWCINRRLKPVNLKRLINNFFKEHIILKDIEITRINLKWFKRNRREIAINIKNFKSREIDFFKEYLGVKGWAYIISKDLNRRKIIKYKVKIRKNNIWKSYKWFKVKNRWP